MKYHTNYFVVKNTAYGWYKVSKPMSLLECSSLLAKLNKYLPAYKIEYYSIMEDVEYECV